MRAAAILAVVLSCVAAGAREQTLPMGSVRLTGRVVAADTGSPLRGATVAVRAPGRLWTVSSDEEGRFEIRDLPAQVLTLIVTKSGFIPSDVVSITPAPKEGAVIQRGDVRLARAAAIAGRVVDEVGEPVADAVVQAYRVIYPLPGQRAIDGSRQATTNDLGEYRVYGLMPGTYYLAAREPQPAIARTSGEAGRAPTFYPGTFLAAEALALTVRGGDQMLGTDIPLRSIPLRQVAGRAVNSRGLPLAGGRAILNPIRPEGAGLVQSSSSPVDGQGHFAFAGVPPGEYRIDMLSAEFLVEIGQAGAVPTYVDAPAREGGSAFVSVPAEGTIPDVLVQLRMGYDLRGHVLVDGAAPTSVEGLRITSASAQDGTAHAAFQSATSQVRPDGSFLLRGLGGTQTIAAQGLPAGAALLRVVAHGLDVTDDGIDMDRGHVAGVEVHVTTKPSVVRGRVTDAAGDPAPGNVIVMSEDPRLWVKRRSRFVVLRPASRNGFSVAGLPAGRYLVVAVEGIDQQTWADPLNLERLARAATPFTLTEGGSVELTLVRR